MDNRNRIDTYRLEDDWSTINLYPFRKKRNRTFDSKAIEFTAQPVNQQTEPSSARIFSAPENVANINPTNFKFRLYS